MHGRQLGALAQSRSAQSIAPSPSSSIPLLQISVVMAPLVDRVMVVDPSVPVNDCTTIQ